MNNLSAFGDVVNGIRSALFNLNIRIDSIKGEVNALQTKVNDPTSSLQEETVRQWVAELEQSINSKLLVLEQQFETLRCQCTPPEPVVVENGLTLEVVQELIDVSLAKLLEGVQPASTFELMDETTQVVDNQQELPIQEPVAEVTIEPVVAATTKTKKTTTRKGVKKP